MTSVSFRAVVESVRGGGHVVEKNPDFAGKLGAKNRTRVRGTLDEAAAARMSIGTAPVHVDRPTGEEVHEPDFPWIVIVWNDPINLMSYVTWVFMRLFGYPREKAESDVARLHAHGLWATLQQDR